MPSKCKSVAKSSVNITVLMPAFLHLKRTMQVSWWVKSTLKSVALVYSAYFCSYKIWVMLCKVCIMCFLQACFCSQLQRNALCWSAELPVFLSEERKHFQNNKHSINLSYQKIFLITYLQDFSYHSCQNKVYIWSYTSNAILFEKSTTYD